MECSIFNENSFVLQTNTYLLQLNKIFIIQSFFLLWCHASLFVKLFLFFYTYYVGIAVIARWPASSISGELLLKIKTFDINFTEMPP
jgi:hypothetical protein